MKKIIIIIILILTFSVYNQGTEHVNENDRNILTLENIYLEMLKLNIQEPLIVLAQVYHETANLKSRVCLNRNNLLGYNTPKGYRKFDSWQDCISYAKEWQVKHYEGGDYFLFLKKMRYAKDTKYISKLKISLAKIMRMEFLLQNNNVHRLDIE